MYHRSVDGSPIRPTRADRRSAAAKLCFSPSGNYYYYYYYYYYFYFYDC